MPLEGPSEEQKPRITQLGDPPSLSLSRAGARSSGPQFPAAGVPQVSTPLRSRAGNWRGGCKTEAVRIEAGQRVQTHSGDKLGMKWRVGDQKQECSASWVQEGPEDSQEGR